MGALKQIALAVLLISLITFVALFGRLPAFRYVPRRLGFGQTPGRSSAVC